MMQIVLNTLQTDSGDQAGSSCLSQKQKMKGDVQSWAKWRAPQPVGCCRPGAEGPRWGCNLYGLLCGPVPPTLSILNATVHHSPPLSSLFPRPVLTLTSPCCSQVLTCISFCFCIPALKPPLDQEHSSVHLSICLSHTQSPAPPTTGEERLEGQALESRLKI